MSQRHTPQVSQLSANRIFLADTVSHRAFHDVSLKCSFQSDVSILPYSSDDLLSASKSRSLFLKVSLVEIFWDVQWIQPVRMKVNCFWKVSRLYLLSTKTRGPRKYVRNYHYSSSRLFIPHSIESIRVKKNGAVGFYQSFSLIVIIFGVKFRLNKRAQINTN